jgi:uncharacterized protein (DUF58 family)
MRAFLRGRMARWARRRQGPDRLPLSLLRRRLYILPTRAGLGFASLVVLMLVAGFNYANSTALFLAFVLAAFGLVAMHQCHRNLLGMTLVAVAPNPAFARDKGVLTLTFSESHVAARYRIGAGLDGVKPVTIDVTGGGPNIVELPVHAAKRGILRIERFLLATTHPYGLFRAWTWVHLPIELLVYPCPLGPLPMPAQSGAKSDAHSSTKTGCDEWLGLRAFRDGDSPRQVDWKAYARQAPLLVKEYSTASSELRLFDFATLGSLQTEARLEQLARWVVDAETRGDRYGLTVPGTMIEPDRGPEHRHRCLAALALFA